MYQFELLAGGHVGEDGTRYGRGDRVSSKLELDKRFGSDKFRRIVENGESVAPPPVQSDVVDEKLNLDAMTVQQLRDFAEQEEIDLEGATKKADIVAVIREWL